MIIKYFSWLKDITKTDSEEILDRNIKDITSLKKFLSKKYPLIKNHIYKNNYIRIAINLEYISDLNYSIKSNDEVAIFPPVSGG